MRRPLLVFAALAAVTILFLVRLAPASLADARIATATRGAIRLTDAEGTLWDARGILAAGATRMPVRWRIDAWPLLRREVHLHLVRGDGDSAAMPKGDIAIGANGVELRDVDATIPAGLLTAAARASAALAGGDVELRTALVEWAPPANRGDARVRWIGAWIAVPGRNEPTALGDTTLTLAGAGDRFSGPVSNTGGDIAVRGNVGVAAQTVQLSLVLTPRNADDRNLAQALSLIGVRDGDGWRVEWRFPLR